MKGLLIFDDGKKPLEEKVKRASEQYWMKNGTRPTLCQVHLTDATPGITLVDGVQVEGKKFILKNHLLIGVE